jgi:hypothetical protein
MAKALPGTGGRRAAIEAIDAIMGDTENLAHFRERLQEAFDENPLQFYNDFVIPLVPKTHMIEDNTDRGIQINIVMKREPKQVQSTVRDSNVESTVVELEEGTEDESGILLNPGD